MKQIHQTRVPVLLMAMALLINPLWVSGQDKKQKQKPAPEPATQEFQFTVIKQIQATSPKSQASTSTCWCFSTNSMVESEVMRLGKPEVGLSEMFTVHNAYLDKASQYVKFHGTTNFAEGGEQHDVLNSIKKYGIVPRDVYPGLNYGEKTHKHGEFFQAMNGIVQNVVKNPNGKVSPVWLNGINGILDAYLGERPASFTYDGKTFTPSEFAKYLGINPDDYIEFTSYTHHPFYEKCVLEIPDNWAQQGLYNVPIDELMEIIDYSLDKGISIAWGADISDLGWADGVGRIMAEGASVKDPQAAEKVVSQDDRQYMFDSYQLTDDHGMHLMGIAKDQFGNKFYMEKNSWGEGGKYKGYSYMSVPFMRMRTMSILLHKDGVPPVIAKKIGLK
ncbi:MAG: C1 family peptidase [Bacteroidales bacterium]|nr:C1 family peptidase [Bacteroidales bacterium]